MTWDDDIMEVFAIGEVLTVPDLIGRLKQKYPTYDRACFRGHINRILVKNEKYGIMKRRGISEGDNHSVQWERVA